jgi:hypothetical protein
MKYLLFLMVSLLCTFPVFGQQTLTETSVYFETDKHNLTAESETSLSKFITFLEQRNDDYEIIIEAHTDGRASQTYNTELSQRRAKSVESYLSNKNIKASNISIKVFGEENPSFSNDDVTGMRKNRRVDIKAITVENKISELETFLMTETQKRTQTFTIKNDEKNLIIGNSGTKVYIDENTFVFENGEIPTLKDVNLSMKEAYTIEDMMIFRLSTHANEKLLETGGMVFLEATSQGRILKIQDGKSIKIGLPTDKLKEEMQLFDGVSNGIKIDWKATNQGFAVAPFEFTFPVTPESPVSRISYYVKRNSDFTPMLNEAQHDYYKKDISKLILYIDLVAPQRPEKPYEPQLEQVLHENNLKSIFISKKKVEKEIQDTYNRRVKVYNRKLKIYNNELIEYKKDSIHFPEWMAYQKRMLDIATGKLMAEFDADFKVTGNVANQKLQNYFFANNQLGWINCDRFYGTPQEQKMTLTINDNDNEEELIYVAFDEMNACINVNRQDETSFTTVLIPKSAKVTIIALKVKNGKNYIAKHKTVANEKAIYDLIYQPVSSSEELKDLLKL